jgi:glycosyltransferase 2 family protein
LSETSKKSRKINLRWLPGVLVSAIAIFAIFKFVQFKDLAAAFSKVGWLFILIVFSIDVITMMVRGIAWRYILGGKVTWAQSFFGVCEGYFLNNIFPLRAGELGRSIFVGKSSGLGTFHVLSTIVIERAFDIVIAAILILVTLPLVVGLAWVKTVALVALAIVITLLVGLFLLARNREKVGAWMQKWGADKRLIGRFILPQMSKLMDGLAALTNPKQFLLSFFWIAITWFMWVIVYDVMVWQVIPDAPIWSGAFVGSVLALGVAIPSAPAALGVYEATMVAAVVVLGGDESSALAVALIMHVLQFISCGIFGIWGLAREGQSLSSLYSRLQIRDEEKSDPTTGVG